MPRPAPLPRSQWATLPLVGLIRLYQYSFSAVGAPSCRFTPTCSGYAIEALQRHGMARGGWLALRRIARCHPWGGDGSDPVPERRAPK